MRSAALFLTVINPTAYFPYHKNSRFIRSRNIFITAIIHFAMDNNVIAKLKVVRIISQCLACIKNDLTF